MNITETCDQPEEERDPVLNLITDTEVTVASAPDNGFLEQSPERTQEIITGEIEKVYADGAYHSVDNQEYCQSDDHKIGLLLTGIQGAAPRYDIRLDDSHENNLIVTDNKTGETIQAQRVTPRKDHTQRKWRIKTETGKYRYFEENDLRTAALKQKLKATTPSMTVQEYLQTLQQEQ